MSICMYAIRPLQDRDERLEEDINCMTYLPLQFAIQKGSNPNVGIN
jgi:hypothetical protein